MVAKKAAIIFGISVSSFEASSNPGVSMRITSLSSRVNPSVGWTSAVRDSKFVPVGSSKPLARLMNWRQQDEFPVIVTKWLSAYRCFSASSRTHDSVAIIRMTFQQVSGLSGTHAILMGGPGAN